MKKEKLNIIFEDKYIIVVNKKSGLLTISTDKEKDNTLYHQVYDYLKKKNKNNKVFIVHRLDKDTSGLIIFAKSEKVKKILQENWNYVVREYVGIVNGKLKNNKGVLKAYLKETNTHLVYDCKNDSGKLAITEYEVLKTNNNYSLLKINIKTGRKHQIRVQLANIGNSLVGDKIYDKKKNKGIKQLYLHALSLKFNHPITKELIILKTNYPKTFLNIIDYK